MAETAILTLCIALVLLPPRWDPAIILKEYQMGYRDRHGLARGLMNAVLPALALWASLAFIGWIIFLK